MRIGIRGEPLVIVLNQPFNHLPNDIVGLIDHHAVLRPLDTKDLSAIIEEITQTSLPVIADDLTTGLTLDQIAGAIRLRDNPAAMIRRLHALRQSANRTRSIAVPKLQDLSGYGEAKAWGLMLSREIDRYRAGEITLADLPKGLLLSGPPGCGKTLFAQSLAVTCNIPIVPSSVADWLQNGDGHLGDVMLAVKKVFDTAHQQQKPAVLFLDECDAFIDPSKTRDRSNWWQTLRAGVLSSIDGASTEPGLIILGACNYPELVDPALRRSGRLDRHIEIPLPDADALASMLQSALADELPDADYQRYGKDIIGSTGADVARFVREIRARARDHGRNVTADDVKAVLSPPDQRPADLIRRIAFHEAGHAVVASLLDRDVKAVSLSKADTGFGGYVLATRPMIFTHASIEEEVLIGLAGRASEVMFGLAASSGASADLVEVTRLLVRAHASYGFGSSLSSIDETADIQQLFIVDTRLKQIVDNDLDQLWRRTIMIVEQNAQAIRSVAERLIERRHLEGDEISQIVAMCRSGPALVTE
ncbi:ATP-dependent Zn proteases [Saliniramus fredricksonii]|uniref:ATP-dependent Zn proteases n=1 Tax=Saliniramus fredricksonii TaxID=1653334 RepID=A0ABY0K4N3_9HYPH|nr:ATP-dependent Zn proteases [Saliniramus fredricksonii]